MTDERNNANGKDVSVLLAHRHTLVRESLVGLLQEAGFKVVAEAERVEDLARLTARYSPDILLLAWDLSRAQADTIRHLVKDRAFPGAVVLLGPPESSESVVEAVVAGARGYLSLNLSGEDFVSRLRLLARGDFVVSQDMAHGLGQQMEAIKTEESNDGLSNREREVLVLVSTGATNKEIARELTVTENTVKVHLRHILDKLDLRNRQEAAAYAVREGIVVDETADQPDNQPSP